LTPQKQSGSASLSSFLNFGSTPKNYTFFDFLSLVQSLKNDHLEKVIPQLPKEYLQNYTLMKSSRSLQSATPSAPRALLFGVTGNLILSFNGLPEQSGYSGIETAEFDETTKKIYFREILFKGNLAEQPDRQNLELAPDEIFYQDSQLIVSEPNPMKCMACHTDRPYHQDEERQKKGADRLAKYIWFPYDKWIGAYGEDDDNLKENDLEFLNYRKQASLESSRYHSLATDRSNPSFPYNYHFAGGEELMPNHRLNILTAIHYMDQTLSVMPSREVFPRIKDDIFKRVLGCRSLDPVNELLGHLKEFLENPQNEEARRFIEEATKNKKHLDPSDLAIKISLIALGWEEGKLNLNSRMPRPSELLMLGDQTKYYGIGYGALFDMHHDVESGMQDFIFQALVAKNDDIQNILRQDYIPKAQESHMLPLYESFYRKADPRFNSLLSQLYYGIFSYKSKLREEIRRKSCQTLFDINEIE
jgi:hypothetical protein